jgi:signal transduction histidine kinase
MEASMDKVQIMLDKEINAFQMEKRYLHKDGRVIWVMLTVSLVWETEEKPKFFIAQIVDITTTKYLIKALEQNNEALQVTALDLESKIKQLEEFNKIVAHNLRGPAGNMHMLLELLPAEMPEISDSIYYKMLSQGCDNMKQTLDELMKVVEVRLNRQIKFDDCHVGEILNNTLVSFKAQLLEKNAVVEQRLEEVTVSYPKVYLESIVYNLVSNALKYSRPQVNPHIQVSTYSENGRFVLSVKDNGLGIDLNKYGHQVFKLKKVFHKGFDSKGVGLFMTKNQIETFGGSISIQSTPMEGSEFIVKF